MKTAEGQGTTIIKEYADEIQQNLDERNDLIAESLKGIYESLQEFAEEINERVREKQKGLNIRLSALFEEIEGLERGIGEIEEFLCKVSLEITKFIETGEGFPAGL